MWHTSLRDTHYRDAVLATSGTLFRRQHILGTADGTLIVDFRQYACKKFIWCQRESCHRSRSWRVGTFWNSDWSIDNVLPKCVPMEGNLPIIANPSIILQTSASQPSMYTLSQGDICHDLTSRYESRPPIKVLCYSQGWKSDIHSTCTCSQGSTHRAQK